MLSKSRIIHVVLALLFVVLAVFLLPSVSKGAADRPLRIGYPPWIGYDILIHAERTGMFERHGVDVELIRFEETSDVARAVMSGGLDAGFTGLGTLLSNHDGTPMEVVLFTNISNGADGIVARRGIDSVVDLRGMRVGFKLRATNRLILAEALAHHGMTIDDITVVDVSNTGAERMLANGSIDAAVIWEPDLTELAESIGGKVIHRTSDLESVVLDTMVARSELVSERSEDFERVRDVWFELLEEIDEDPESVFETVGAALREDPARLQQYWGGLIPAERSLNRRLLGELFEKNLGSVSKLMRQPRPRGIRAATLSEEREGAR